MTHIIKERDTVVKAPIILLTTIVIGIFLGRCSMSERVEIMSEKVEVAAEKVETARLMSEANQSALSYIELEKQAIEQAKANIQNIQSQCDTSWLKPILASEKDTTYTLRQILLYNETGRQLGLENFR